MSPDFSNKWLAFALPRHASSAQGITEIAIALGIGNHVSRVIVSSRYMEVF